MSWLQPPTVHPTHPARSVFFSSFLLFFDDADRGAAALLPLRRQLWLERFGPRRLIPLDFDRTHLITHGPRENGDQMCVAGIGRRFIGRMRRLFVERPLPIDAATEYPPISCVLEGVENAEVVVSLRLHRPKLCHERRSLLFDPPEFRRQRSSPPPLPNAIPDRQECADHRRERQSDEEREKRKQLVTPDVSEHLTTLRRPFGRPKLFEFTIATHAENARGEHLEKIKNRGYTTRAFPVQPMTNTPKLTSKLSRQHLAFLTAFATSCRRTIIEMLKQSQSGHPGGSLGCIDYLSLLYAFIVSQTGEKVIVSNGHISPAVYAVLERDRLAARWPVLLLCSLTAALVVLRHRANVKRLIAGTEPRIGEGKK